MDPQKWDGGTDGAGRSGGRDGGGDGSPDGRQGTQVAAAPGGRRILYPRLVRTERVTVAAEHLDLSSSALPVFVGLALVALAADQDVMENTGSVLVAAALARDHGFTDVDGNVPRPLTLDEA